MANPSTILPLRAKVYVTAVNLAGAAVLGISIPAVVFSTSQDWILLAGLALLTGSFTVKVPSVPARLSVSEAFVFAAVLLYGPEVATIVVAIDTLVMSLRLRSRSRSAYRVSFNIAAGSVAIWLSGHLFFGLAGSGPPVNLTLERLLLPLAALSLTYFTLNSWLIAFALSYERGVSSFNLWRSSFVWLSLNYVGGASVATLLVSYTQNVNLTALGIIVPLLLITYLTLRTSIGRLEDANRHVAQLNELYLSTIETLAMAVDAKDQITHGHIRRVQVYATELARHLGVTDERQLKAIEAAALLHDMGKLAIPEHILNKPGKLTPGEFDKMKRHADIGADLLSSIPFPYPVVPIVRHHHENWDGNGYPNRVAGTDIPLGARILAVVDCFDALTSDRPYRPRLTNEASFEILRERRGTMYDPLIVDAFMSAYTVIAPMAIQAGQQARSLLPAGRVGYSAHESRALHEIRAESAEATALYDARLTVPKAQSPGAALDAVSHLIRQFTPATLAALYTYVPQADVIRCAHATGDPDGLLRVLEIHNGERTSGWVAANRETIVNSSASLDLGPIAARFSPSLKAAMSCPIESNETVLGVVTVYSTLESPFSDRHRYVLEQLAALLVEPISRKERSQPTLVRFPEVTKNSNVRN